MKKCGLRRAAYITISGRQEKKRKRSLANIFGDRNYLKMGTGNFKSPSARRVSMCELILIHPDSPVGSPVIAVMEVLVP